MKMKVEKKRRMEYMLLKLLCQRRLAKGIIANIIYPTIYMWASKYFKGYELFLCKMPINLNHLETAS